jgi:hypothetical protein
MAQLYRHKWRSSEGDIFDERDEFTSGFLLWCRKTEGLSDAEWRRGFDLLESDLRDAEREGRAEPWPPSYAVFVEKCRPGVSLSLYKSFDRSVAIEDLGAKAKRYESGAKHCESLLGLFD